MSALRKIEASILPDKLRRGLKGKRTVYVKLFDATVIDSIRKKMKARTGLTEGELRIATEAGLIDWEQRYFWTTDWQAGEKAANEDERRGRIPGPFQTADAALKRLHTLPENHEG